MTRTLLPAVLLLLLAVPAWAGELQIYFIDVEGGQATLVVTPAGESLLLDAGYGRSSRDPDRIMAAVQEAGIDRIDYLLVSHFHPDHVGGVPELASRIPIGTFVDYGEPLGTPYGADRMTVRSFASYEPIRRLGRQLHPGPGDPLPLSGVETVVVSSGGELLSTPLPGASSANGACSSVENHPEDGTENFRSLGIVLRFGRFSLVNLGDLSGNTLFRLVCPENLLGPASVYVIPHHGDYDTNSPAMYEALAPRVAILNNGATKGGDPATLRTAQAHDNLDLWQLHASRHPESENVPEDQIANLMDENCEGHWLRLVASEDGSFSITNGRTGSTRTYPPPPAPALD